MCISTLIRKLQHTYIHTYIFASNCKLFTFMRTINNNTLQQTANQMYTHRITTNHPLLPYTILSDFCEITRYTYHCPHYGHIRTVHASAKHASVAVASACKPSSDEPALVRRVSARGSPRYRQHRLPSTETEL